MIGMSKTKSRSGAKHIKRGPLANLTNKQSKLIENLDKAKTKTELGEIAGYSCPQATSRALRSVQVQEALDYLGISPHWVLNNFKKIASHNPDDQFIKASDVLRANENIAKVVDIYPAQRTENTSKSLSISYQSMDSEELSLKLEELDKEIQLLNPSTD